MAVRKTESRIPQDLSPSDLGQAEVATDGKSALISLIISPVAVNRNNLYVVFVTDAGLASAVETFEWSFSENGGAATVQTTGFGEAGYSPGATGTLTVRVRMLGAGSSEVASLTMNQKVVKTNAELEELIVNSKNEPGPGIGNIDVARELVNDHNPYYQAVTTSSAAELDAFKRFVFSMTSDGVLHRTAQERKTHLDQLASAINEDGDLVTPAGMGAGVCAIRLSMLGMVYPNNSGNKWISWTELPESGSTRLSADEQLRQVVAGLEENRKIDVFNLVRFPKSNIIQCGKILEALRDRYFAGAGFNDVLTGMSGTRAHWIVRHYSEGPLKT